MDFITTETEIKESPKSKTPVFRADDDPEQIKFWPNGHPKQAKFDKDGEKK